MARAKKKRPAAKAPRASVLGGVSAALLGAAFTVYLLAAGSYTSITGLKFTLFLVLCIGFLALTAVLWLLELPERGLDRAALRPRGAEWCALAYLLLTLLSAALSPYEGVWLGNGRQDGALTVALYVLTFLALSRWARPERYLAWALGAGMTLYCLLGLAQLLGFNPLGLYPHGVNYFDAGTLYAGAYFSATGNADMSAAVLATAAGALAALLICGEGRRDRLLLIPFCLTVFTVLELDVEAALLALLAGGLLLPCLIVTGGARLRRLFFVYGAGLISAGAALALRFTAEGPRLAYSAPMTAALCAGAGSMALGALAGARHWGETTPPGRLRLLLAAVTGAAALAALGFVYLYDGFYAGFLYEAHQLLHGVWDDSFGSGRLLIWRQAAARIAERPLLGGGPDTLGQRGLESFIRYDDAAGIALVGAIDAAHNEYLNIAVNQGLPALLAYLGLLGSSAAKAVRGAARPAVAAAGAAALLYLIQALFGVSTPANTLYLWLALALINTEA